MTVISTVFGGLLLFPYIITLVFLVVSKKMGRAPASVIGFAADVTTPFLFLTVYVVSSEVIGQGTGVYIVTITLMIAIFRIVMERTRVKEFQIIDLLRKTWRLYFLILTVCYVLLLLVGIIMRIIEYTT